VHGDLLAELGGKIGGEIEAAFRTTFGLPDCPGWN
jgi:hypothetical protein